LVQKPNQGAPAKPVLFVLTGPESTAKTTLTEALSVHFKANLVAEASRQYLANKQTYLPSDLLKIAQHQQASEQSRPAGIAFADTDLQVLSIWWSERFGPVPYALSHDYAAQSLRHYLLCKPDIDWQPDSLRENAHDRERLFTLYENDLKARALNYTVVDGIGDKRLSNTITRVANILSI